MNTTVHVLLVLLALGSFAGILYLFGFGVTRCRKCKGVAVRFDYATENKEKPSAPLVVGKQVWCLHHADHTEEILTD